MPHPAVIREAALAKVNLSLRVLGRRPDGYHEIESLVAFARSGADDVEFIPGGTIAVATSGPFAASLKGENLAEAALRSIAEAAPAMRLGEVRLTKNLPVAAGIGGGSADAAAVLRAVRTANGEAARVVDWAKLAARLGADVPMCLMSRACFVRGIGDEVTLLPELPRIAAVLANSLTPMPQDKTARVFKRLAAPLLDDGQQKQELPRLTTPEDLIAYMASVGNDLRAAALSIAPEIGDVMGVLEATQGCRYMALSGAGPTCFGVYDNLEAAQNAARAIAQRRPGWWVLASELA